MGGKERDERSLSSNAKCNTPRRFDIGKVVQGSVGRKHHLPGAAAERSPFGRVLAASRRRSLSIAQAARSDPRTRGRFTSVRGGPLAEGWTPEQISGWLKSGNEPRLRAIGCETISAFIYRTAQKAAALWRYLTRRHKRPRPRRARASRDAIKDRASIHDRPKTIEGRGEAGHWEGDLIICKCARPVLVLHERKSRVTLAARLSGKTAAETISAMLAVFGRIDPQLRRSITFDNDTAFAQHAAQDHARHDDLVLRRLCLMAKRRHRKRQWTLTSMAAAPSRYRPDIRPRNPGDRPHDQPHPP